MTSLSEHLSAQFYDWEKRGRGWPVYDYLVVLEPPFRPFLGFIPLPGVGHDDGRRPGIAESVWSAVRGTKPETPEAPSYEFEEPDADEDPEDEDFVELQIKLPAEIDVSAELAEQLLANLLTSQQKLGFEILGIGRDMVLQFVVPGAHADDLRAAIETYIPEVCISEIPTLRSAWETNESDETVVVEFGLSNEFLLPLATPRSFRIDPLLGFLSTLEALDDHELGLVQVLFEPTRNPWGRTAVQWLTGSDGAPIFPDSKPLLAGASEKFSRPLVAAVVRVAARAENEERAWAIVRRLGGALAQFAAPGGNELIPLEADGYHPFDQERDVVLRRTHRGGMLLSTAELAGLVHVPSSSVRSEQVRASPQKSKAAPETVTSGEICLGENVHRGRRVEVRLPLATRLRHTHIVGATGTGKSSLLRDLMRQDLEAGRGFALLDPHGDLADDILALVPENRLSDVVLFDPSDEDYPVGFNVLRARSDREKNLLASDMTAIFRRFSTTWGDQMTAVMSSAVMALLECETGGTLLDLRRFLSDREFRETVLASVRDPMLLSFWRQEFPRLPGARSQMPIITRLDAFLRPKSIRNAVAQRESRLDLRALMDQGGIFIAKLSQGAIGEENAHLLGSLLVSKLHQLAMSREQLVESARRPFFLYIDEFHHFLTPSLTGLLTGARKYGVGLVLAHQELRQLGDTDMRGAVLTNPATRVCFRLGDEDARLLASGFASFTAEDLVNLGVGDAICRVGQSSHDFNLRVRTPRPIDAAQGNARREAIREGTRERFGTPRDEVEAMIAASWSTSAPPAPPRTVSPAPSPRQAPAPSPPTPQHVDPLQPAPAAASAAPPSSAPRPPTPAAPPTPVVPEPATPGRGGPQHKYLQSLIASHAQNNGFLATIEAEVGQGGRIDVLLVRSDLRIAVEISITTSPDQEIGNLKKCLDSAVDQVVVVSPTPSVLKRIREQAKAALPAFQFERVRFLSPEEFVTSLQPLPEPPSPTVRGYKVKTTVKTSDPDAAASSKQSIAKTIADALRRLKKE